MIFQQKISGNFEMIDGRKSLTILENRIHIRAISRTFHRHSPSLAHAKSLLLLEYLHILPLSVTRTYFSLSVTYSMYGPTLCIHLLISAGRSRELCVTECITLFFFLLPSPVSFNHTPLRVLTYTEIHTHTNAHMHSRIAYISDAVFYCVYARTSTPINARVYASLLQRALVFFILDTLAPNNAFFSPFLSFAHSPSRSFSFSLMSRTHSSRRNSRRRTPAPVNRSFTPRGGFDTRGGRLFTLETL